MADYLACRTQRQQRSTDGQLALSAELQKRLEIAKSIPTLSTSDAPIDENVLTALEMAMLHNVEAASRIGRETGIAVLSTTCLSTKLECTPVTPSMRVILSSRKDWYASMSRTMTFHW